MSVSERQEYGDSVRHSGRTTVNPLRGNGIFDDTWNDDIQMEAGDTRRKYAYQ